jgi:hypothetical protein
MKNVYFDLHVRYWPKADIAGATPAPENLILQFVRILLF